MQTKRLLKSFIHQHYLRALTNNDVQSNLTLCSLYDTLVRLPCRKHDGSAHGTVKSLVLNWRVVAPKMAARSRFCYQPWCVASLDQSLLRVAARPTPFLLCSWTEVRGQHLWLAGRRDGSRGEIILAAKRSRAIPLVLAPRSGHLDGLEAFGCYRAI